MNRKLSNVELLNEINKIEFFILRNQDRNELLSLLKELIYINIDNVEKVSRELINMIGNNHSGIYYVEASQVIDFLILVLENSIENKIRGICVLSILNNLFYFQPVFYSDKSKVDKKLQGVLKNKLNIYSDDNFDNLMKMYE
ncbi:hypothetical protein [Pasteurella sp. PK-2025]|uniref:hypothetical protein n=1 Tax=unclassified Pasteurella TaxID=2621516 RepID=UPI003C768A9F